MRGLIRTLAVFFFSLGGFGLLLLGILDSSLLFMPLGNDLLVVALTAAHRQRMLYYVLMATAGSTIGVDFTRWVSARGAEKTLEDTRKRRRFAYVERKVKERGAFALAVAALMPPPFPFTPFVMVAGALQYPRRKMLVVIAAARALRFGVEGTLALIYGRGIIRMARAPWVANFILVLVVVSVAGSIWSLVSLIRKSRVR
jgi:membrane protein YqaA with SNARE-associated domain